MEMQVGKLMRKRVVLTRAELLKVSAFLKQLAEAAPGRGPGVNIKEEVVLVDVRVFLGGGTWWFLPAEFKITSSEVVFSNENEGSDIKLTFSSNLVKTELEIPAGATATLDVEKGADDDNKVDLYARNAGSADQWKKINSGTGNGAEMKINNP